MGLLTRRARTWLVAAGAAAIVTAANASQGAYFSQSWGWVALAFLVPVAVVLILGVVEAPGMLRASFAVLVAALGVWIVLSATWSVSSAASIREGERMLVYVAVALALALLLRQGDTTGLAVGMVVGTVSIAGYGLATRLFPERFDAFDVRNVAYRLSEPIGYWNSFGLLAAMGLLLAVGSVAHARRASLAMIAGLALPVLTTALYFSFSRGAWIALGVGYAVAVAIDPRRLRLLWSTLVLAPASVLSIAVASRQEALTMEEPPPAAAVAQGERLALWLVAFVILSGVSAALAAVISRRFAPSLRFRRAVDVALVVASAVALAAGVAARGGPGEALSDLRERFDTELATTTPGALNERLFSFSGTGRAEHLRVAWDMAHERPVIGNGAGTYEYFWYQDRETTFVVRDAHSLYAEMLAEVGIVGVALLALTLVVPLAAAVRGRRRPFAAVSTGTFVAWVAHSSLDWNWEVVGVTTTALLAAGIGLLAGERTRRPPIGDRLRVPAAAIVTALSVLAVVSLVGNQALFAGREAVARKEWANAVDDAQRADRLLPWSHEPAIVLGDAAAGLGDRAGALVAYRSATATDPENWVAWLRLAQVAEGGERTRAYARVHELNPLEEDLPGERR